MNPEDAQLEHAADRMLALTQKGYPLGSVLEILCHTVEALLNFQALTSVLLLRDGHLWHGAGPSLPEEYNAAINGIEIGPMVGSCGTAAFTAKPVIVEDITTDPKWAAFVALATGHGLAACWSMPILNATGKVLGTFAIYYSRPRSPSARDLELVQKIADVARRAIEKQ